MAPSHIIHRLFILSTILVYSTSTATATPTFTAQNRDTFLLSIIKDPTKHQYYTTFLLGTRTTIRVNLLIDLSNKFSWLTCDIYGYTSSSYRPISCNSHLCSTYGGTGCNGCFGFAKPSCNNNTCGAVAYTPWSRYLYSAGLIQDSITSGGKTLLKFPFTCADKGPLKNLSQFSKGILTLARTPASVHLRVSSAFKVPHKFALCLPSSPSPSTGKIYFGGGPYNLPASAAGQKQHLDLSARLVRIPIVTNPNSTAPIYSVGEPSIEYFINLQSIKVDEIPIRFNSSLLGFDGDGNGGTKLSTLEPYTKLHSEIYRALVGAFVARAKAAGLERMDGVGGFGVCLQKRSRVAVPVVDLVMENKSELLHGKNARWRIYGWNLMVEVTKEVDCLGVVDGGEGVQTAVVIGGKQMEDNLIEFDLVKGEIGVSSSLLRHGTSCAQLK